MWRLFKKKEKYLCFLMFHSVSEQPSSPNYLCENSINADTFEELIRTIAARYDPVAIDEALQSPALFGKHKSGVIVSFDDGFQDNLTTVLPILQKYNVPAIIYVTTGFIDRTVFPFEYQLANAIGNKQSLSFALADTNHKFALDSQQARQSCYWKIKNLLKPVGYKTRLNILSEIDPKSTYQTYPTYMSIAELKRLSSSPLITIGAHTHYHQQLNTVPITDAACDIREGKKTLESWIGREVRHFAYPYGSYDTGITQLVKQNGFSSAVTTKQELATHSDMYTLPRLDIKNKSQLIRTVKPWQ